MNHNALNYLLSAKRITVAILIIAMVLCGAGCVPVTYIEPTETTAETNNITPTEPEKITPVKTIRTLDEILATGITPNDVLAVYDELAKDVFEAYYGDEASKKQLTANVEDYNNAFVSIGTLDRTYYDYWGNKTPEKQPFFCLNDKFNLVHPWFVHPNGILYKPILEGIEYNVIDCELTINTNLNNNYNQNNSYNYFGIERLAMEDLLKAFGSKKFNATKDYVYSLNVVGNYGFIVGKAAYTPITITRESILSADEKQLWALYNALQSIYSINFYGELPEENRDYTILEIE